MTVVIFSPSLEEVVTVAFNISITDDTAVESNEQFEVILSTSQEAVLVESEANTATVNITDDDSKPCMLEGIIMYKSVTSRYEYNIITPLLYNSDNRCSHWV